MITLIFLLLFIQVQPANGCLVIGYSEPPPCACTTFKLNAGNIFANMKNSSVFFRRVRSSNIEEPIVSIDDCAGNVYCEEDYDLYVFSEDNDIKFGAYAAEGMCQPFSQTWLMDDGSGSMATFKEMKAVFIKRSACNCSYVELDNSNAYEYLKNSKYYNDVLKNHPFKPPNITLSEDGCQKTRVCDEGWKSMTWFDPSNDDGPTDKEFFRSSCLNSNNKWYLERWLPHVVEGYYWSYFAPICVDFSRTI